MGDKNATVWGSVRSHSSAWESPRSWASETVQTTENAGDLPGREDSIGKLFAPDERVLTDPPRGRLVPGGTGNQTQPDTRFGGVRWGDGVAVGRLASGTEDCQQRPGRRVFRSSGFQRLLW